jgi:hypothetical protein
MFSATHAESTAPFSTALIMSPLRIFCVARREVSPLHSTSWKKVGRGAPSVSTRKLYMEKFDSTDNANHDRRNDEVAEKAGRQRNDGLRPQ